MNKNNSHDVMCRYCVLLLFENSCKSDSISNKNEMELPIYLSDKDYDKDLTLEYS